MEYINRLRYKGTVPTLATSSGLVNNAVYDDMGIVGDPEPPTPTPTTYIVIQTAGGNGVVVANPDGRLVSGTSVSLSVTPDTGYEFVNMIVSMGEFSATATTLPYVIDSVTDDIYVQVSCIAIPPESGFQVNITINPSGNTDLHVSGGGIYQEDDICTLTASSDDPDYEFMQWVYEPTGLVLSHGNNFSFAVTHDFNIRADFRYNEPMPE